MRWSSLTRKMGQTQRFFCRRDILRSLVCTFLVLLFLLSWNSRAADTDESSSTTGSVGNTLETDDGESSFATTNAAFNFQPTKVPEDSIISEECEGSVHPLIPMGVAAENERSMTKGSSRLLVLLMSQILLVYGVLRWFSRGEREAQTGGAPKRQELQKDEAEYDEKLKKRAELMMQLAAQKAATARVQAEVEAAAKRADEAESATQPADSVDRAELLKTLASEAAALEAETAALREQLKVVSPVEVPAEDDEQADLAKVYQEQKLLMQKKREMLEKAAEEAILEAKWGDQLRNEAAGVLAAIATATKELEELKRRKQQLSSEAQEIIQSAIRAGGEQIVPADREEQAELMNALVETASTAGEEKKTLEEQKEEYEKLLAELEKHKAELETAKESSAREAALYETQRSRFLESLALLEEELKGYAKQPGTLKGIRKDKHDMLLQKREEIMCQELTDVAMCKHEKLEAYEREMAETFARDDQHTRDQEMAILRRELLDVLPPIERSLIEKRIALLEKEMDEAVDIIRDEAKRSDKDMFMLIEAREMVKYRAHLGVLQFFRKLLKKKPDDKAVQKKIVLAQTTFEEVRLYMLHVLDTASTLLRQNSFDKEINLLYVKHRSFEEARAVEKKRLQELMEEIEDKRDLSFMRYQRARKALGRVGRALSQFRLFDHKCNLLKHKTLVEFYDIQLDRLKEEFRTLSTVYKDKLTQAGDVWLQAQSDFNNALAQKHAMGIVKGFSESDTIQKYISCIEGFHPHDDLDISQDDLFLQVADDGTPDDELLAAEDEDEDGDDDYDTLQSGVDPEEADDLPPLSPEDSPEYIV